MTLIYALRVTKNEDRAKIIFSLVFKTALSFLSKVLKSIFLKLVFIINMFDGVSLAYWISIFFFTLN